MEAVLPEPISPELALVCPELRSRAISALLERERLAELEDSVVGPAPEYMLVRSLAAAAESDDDWVAPLPVAILAYTATSVARLAIEATAFLALLVGVLSVVSVLHS
jgi:hypothetical protein